MQLVGSCGDVPGILYSAAVSGDTSTCNRTDLPELQAFVVDFTVAAVQIGSGPQPMNKTCLGMGSLVESSFFVVVVVVVVVVTACRTEEGTVRTGEKAHACCTAAQSNKTERKET